MLNLSTINENKTTNIKGFSPLADKKYKKDILFIGVKEVFSNENFFINNTLSLPPSIIAGTNKVYSMLSIAATDSFIEIKKAGNQRVETHADSVWNWIHNKVVNPKTLPFAIICELSYLEADNFKLLKHIQNNNFLKHIPFIVVSKNHNYSELYPKERKKIITSLRKKKGIDDFYLLPVSWDDLKNRIEFLHQFKLLKDLSLQGKLDLSEEAPFSSRIPLDKRIFDIMVASLALLVFSPIMLLVAFLVKLESKGPVFYNSKRVGTGYQIFSFHKFRSMRQGADAELKKLKHLNQYSANGKTQAFVKINNDPRVTRIGKFIRKTSLDELPQLLNVLKGEMSIVGNRPLPLYEAEKLTKDVWAKRFLAPAGITGLWQVTKRGKQDMSPEERMELDNTYADRSSLWFDLTIILKTIPAMIQTESV